MNILQINHSHYFRGGTAAVYFKTAELLKSHGHKVIFFSMHHPKNLQCETSEFFVPYADLNARQRMLYSFKAKRLLSELLDKYHVDIAHLHNIYHTISPSILHELKKRKIPVVMSVHDPKLVCGSHNVYVDGKVCDACSGGKHFMAVIKKCVKDSYAKSALAALEMYLHHSILDIYDNVDIFIFTSLFFMEKFKEMGFKKEGVYLPNFIDLQNLREFEVKFKDNKGNSGNYVIYVGGLLEDKGLLTLLDAAKLLYRAGEKIEIKLSGDGPSRGQLHEKARAEKIDNVKFLGYIKYEDLCREIKNSLAVILPAENYENNPISIIEAFALGKPVIGSRLGGIPELVVDNERGLTFEPGNPQDLSSKIKYLLNNSDKAVEWGANARKYIEHELSSDRHYEKLMEIYGQAIKKNLIRRHAHKSGKYKPI
ncbi:MAG: glycosyltransferase family 4 protein [Nitrospirae bacterium]|nr:glycosyltransferase family 4 protein [Nitrospirota bacterium]